MVVATVVLQIGRQEASVSYTLSVADRFAVASVSFFCAYRAAVAPVSYISLIVLLWLLSLGASALACMFFVPSVPHSFLPSFTPLLLPPTGTSSIPFFLGIALFSACPRSLIGHRSNIHVAIDSS